MRRSTAAIGLIALLALSAMAMSQTRTSARRALNSVLPDLRFDNIPLSDAIDFLRDVSGANMHVNWRALEEIGVGKDTTVNVHLRSVPMRKILNLVLSEAGSGNLLTYYIEDDVIEITTRELADKALFTRVYPVDDLIMEVPDFIGPDFQINQTTSTGGSGSSQSLLSGTTNTQNQQATTRAERAQQLVQIIQSIIQPEIWQVNGGTAAIRFWNGSLIVTAPRSVHEALGGPVD